MNLEIIMRCEKTREFLFKDLDNISKFDLWFMICEDYPLDLETIRQFKDFIDWKVLESCDVIERQVDDEDILNALREFRDKLDWEQAGSNERKK